MDEAMFDLARQAMARAHAPYSNFQVGAVVKGKNGKLYPGCNVENDKVIAVGVNIGVLDGERAIAEIAVIGAGEALVTPCGGCRQRIREFATEITPIHICGPEGLRKTVTLGDLLPLSFGPDNLS